MLALTSVGSVDFLAPAAVTLRAARRNHSPLSASQRLRPHTALAPSAAATVTAAATAAAAGALAAAVRSGARRRSLRRGRAARRASVTISGVDGLAAPRFDGLTVDGGRLLDARGRVALPRGVSLGGLSKVPRLPDGATHRGGAAFYQHRAVSFVGRPCDLGELDEHLARLRTWGFTLLRLLVTWEAVEHSGPGEYDEEYLAYLQAVCTRAHDYGFVIIVDPHQDCWSRWTGGDGAPGWTLEAAGFEVSRRLHDSGAAFLHQENGDPLPTMSWPANYDRLGAATMASLFWAGDRLAPTVAPRIAGVGWSLQDFLQGHFVAAMAAVAHRLRDVPSVVGFETLNEPHPGWLGSNDLGFATAGPITTGLSPHVQMQRCAGADGPWANGRCLWAEAGVWDDASGRLLDPGRFACADWMTECFAPFVRRYAAAVRAEMPRALIAVCPPAFGPESQVSYPGPLPDACLWAPHFYDGLVLVSKTWSPGFGVEESELGEKWFGGLLPAPPVKPVFGLENRIESYKRQVKRKCALDAPSLLGEVGVPFDLGSEADLQQGNYEASEEAIDAHLQAFESIFLSFVWWNYTPENSHRRGDGWNGEDLSIFCADDPRDAQRAGGRGISALVRPYLAQCDGKPLAQRFDRAAGFYRCEFEAKATGGESVFFVPRLHYPSRAATSLAISPGSGDVEWPASSQVLTFRAARPGRVVLELRLKTPSARGI